MDMENHQTTAQDEIGESVAGDALLRKPLRTMSPNILSEKSGKQECVEKEQLVKENQEVEEGQNEALENGRNTSEASELNFGLTSDDESSNVSTVIPDVPVECTGKPDAPMSEKVDAFTVSDSDSDKATGTQSVRSEAGRKGCIDTQSVVQTSDGNQDPNVTNEKKKESVLPKQVDEENDGIHCEKITAKECAEDVLLNQECCAAEQPTKVTDVIHGGENESVENKNDQNDGSKQERKGVCETAYQGGNPNTKALMQQQQGVIDSETGQPISLTEPNKDYISIEIPCESFNPESPITQEVESSHGKPINTGTKSPDLSQTSPDFGGKSRRTPSGKTKITIIGDCSHFPPKTLSPNKKSSVDESFNSEASLNFGEVSLDLGIPVKEKASDISPKRDLDSSDADKQHFSELMSSPEGVAEKNKCRLSYGLNFEYGEESAPKFSQSEVDALVEVRLKEQTAELEAVKTQLAAARKASDGRAEELLRKYESEMEIIQTALEKAETELTELRPLAVQCKKQENLVLELAERMETFEAENTAKLQEANDDIRKKQVHLEAITSQLITTKTEANDLKEELENLLVRVESAEATNIKLREELVAQGQVEKSKREAAVQKMKDDMKRIAEEKFAQANKQFSALQTRHKKAEAELNSTSKQLQDAKEKAACCQEESKKAVEQVNSLQQCKTTLEAEVENLKNTISEIEKDRDAAQESLGRLVQQNTSLKAELQDVKAVCEELMGMMEQQK